MSCSLSAAGIAWLISGIVFVVVVRGPAVIWGWLIWGTLFILAGWIIVGLPLVALGDKILRIGRLLVMLIAGIGGALVMELPSFFIMLATTNAGYRWSWSLGDLGWPTIAFAIAAPTGWLYRKLLQEEAQGFRCRAGHADTTAKSLSAGGPSPSGFELIRKVREPEAPQK
jgi:hypothetical protein